MTGFIYYIECEGKVYIGSTSRKTNTRKSEHFSKLSKNKHPNKHLQNAYNKYGKDRFSFGILEECNIDSLYLIESHYIEITGSYIKTKGFNKSKNAEVPNRGKKWTREHKEKISKSLKGRPSPMKGKKNKISATNQKLAVKASRKKVINLNTNEIFESVSSFCKKCNINKGSFYQKVGKYPHKGILFDYYREVN